MEKLKIEVSACLLGQNVRYNGGHQLNHFIRDVLGQYMEFVPVCPEVECGMPIPRETLRLVGNEDAIRSDDQHPRQKGGQIQGGEQADRFRKIKLSA